MPRLAQMMALGNVALHDVAEQLLQKSRVAFVKIAGEPAMVQVGGQRDRSPLPAGVGEVFGLVEREDIERAVTARQLGAEFAAEKRRIGTRHTDRVVVIEKRAD